VREVRLHGANEALTSATAQGLLVTGAANGEVRVVMPHFSEARARAVAQELGAEGYEAGPVGLQDFFIALTAEQE
jgi:hypothetical protein